VSAFVLLLSFTAARPGDVLCGEGYENQGLKYSDLVFYIEKLPDNSFNLSVDVAIRNMKGLKTDDSALRIQPLYQDRKRLPPLFDVTLQLLILTLMDEVFEDVNRIDEIYNIDPQKLMELGSTPSIHEVELAIKPSKLDLPVFCGFKADDARGYATQDSKIWHAYVASHLVHDIKDKIGMHDFTCQSIRRASANALDTPAATEVDVQLSIGHRRGTTTYTKYYQSKRSKVDLQGLMVTGSQGGRDRLVETPQHYIPQAKLTRLEYAQLQDNPELVQARRSDAEVSYLVNG
jgi:hypothetical protein